MPAKIRLARHGRKRYAYYYIVVADSRAPRDGRFIERIGDYNPNTNPATINLDFDKAFDWLLKGAQPTETAKSILSREGVLMKKHLYGGVKKGAFSQEEADKRFDEWMKNKQLRNKKVTDAISATAEAERSKRLEAETKVNKERAEAIAKAEADLAAEAAAQAKAEADAKAAEEAAKAVAEAPKTEALAEEPKAEETPKEEEKPAE
ncbi:MAG: 30S ribosomal protein S16 [Bacteroidales bacterium]